jgi:hypothetical protein
MSGLRTDHSGAKRTKENTFKPSVERVLEATAEHGLILAKIDMVYTVLRVCYSNVFSNWHGVR